MSSRARFAFRVLDLAATLDFYACLGMYATETPPSPDEHTVYLSDGEHLILLADPEVADPKSYLDEPCIVFKPGDKIDFPIDDIDALYPLLKRRAIVYKLQETQTSLGDRQITLHDPNGYKIVLLQLARHTREELLALYAASTQELEQLVANLTNEELAWSRTPEDWSIRQIVHHLAEGDSLFMMQMKLAIAQPGHTYYWSTYDQDHWANVLDYKKRAITPSLALSKAIRAHITQLIQSVPTSWDNTIHSKRPDDETEGTTYSLADLIGIQTRHMAEHCQEIRETLALHGR